MPYTQQPIYAGQQIKWLKPATLLTSGVFFGVSLFGNCFTTTQGPFSSLAALLTGWMGVVYYPCWLANPLLAFSMIFTDRNKPVARILALCATLLALSFLFYGQVMVNEGGGTAPIVSRNLPYWLWTASHFVMCAGSFVYWRRIPA